MASDTPRRFWLLTYPRTASNLLLKILALEDQPTLLPNSKTCYFFLPTLRIRMGLKGIYGKHPDSWTPEQRGDLMQSYQASFDNLQRHIDTAATQRKDIFVKEHVPWLMEPVAETKFVFGEGSIRESPWTVQAIPSQIRSEGNETVLPDAFLKTWLPTFLIRHPALAFPSSYRTCIDNEGIEAAKAQGGIHTLEMTLHWSRSLYDWYAKHFGQSNSRSDEEISWPIVLDADDIMTNPELVLRYCKIIGFDPTKIKSSWAVATAEQLEKMGPVERRMRSTLSASTGIVSGKTSADLDIGEEARKWRIEFGQEEGDKMERWVRAALPDYEYLKARRLAVHPP